MKPRLNISRRRLLGAGSAAIALPALEILGARPARAEGTGPAPKRLLIVHHPQGTVITQHIPVGAETNFSLPYILEPLAAFQDRGIFLAGLDNRIAPLNTVGNSHQQANLSLWTGQRFQTQDSGNITAGGPSIEQWVAERISGGLPFPRIDLCSGGSSANGIYSPGEAAYFWYGAADPVAFYNDPLVALLRIFGDQSMSPADAWAQRARRSAVLDGVAEAFTQFNGRVGAEDKARIEAHLDKLSSLESRIVNSGAACTPPGVALPSGYDASFDDEVSTPLMNELIVAAFGCDLTRVATFHFANSQDHSFPWLWAQNGGPIVDTSRYDNWHAMVHEDHQPGMEHVYRWYVEQLADLLTRLDRATDADGDNMLETTLVVCASEYSSGRHWVNSLPAVLMGHTGSAVRGRFLDFMPVSPEDFVAASNYVYSEVCFSQLLVSIQRILGFVEDRFGYVGDEIPAGGLPGL
jgi:hypothetical protein